MALKINYKLLTPDAKAPVKLREGDFCYDLYAASDGMPVYEERKDPDTGEVTNVLLPGVVRYHTGIAFEIERGPVEIANGFEIDLSKSPIILDIDGRPRSSVYKTGLVLANCEATVDEPYRGEVVVNFYNVVPELPNYKKGDRIVQVKLGMTLPLDFNEVKELNMNTNRGTDAFGSSDKILKN